MTDQDQIERIAQARALLAPLLHGGAQPQIEAILHSADMELHWALWNLGVPVEHRHDMARHDDTSAAARLG